MTSVCHLNNPVSTLELFILISSFPAMADRSNTARVYSGLVTHDESSSPKPQLGEAMSCIL